MEAKKMEEKIRRSEKDVKVEVKCIDAVFKEIKNNTELGINGENEKSQTIWLNPPPDDNRCECCGRHIRELKPFGGPGDPLVGDFNGAFLVKHFRDLCGVGQADTCWDCRDCFILDDETYNIIRFGGRKYKKLLRKPSEPSKMIKSIKEYPSVRVSECKHFDVFSMPFGFRYCEKCNSIILFGPHLQNRFDLIEEDIASILNHETLHWVLLKEISKAACSYLDEIAIHIEENRKGMKNL